VRTFGAVGLALISALCYAAAFVGQHHAAAAVPESKARGLGLYKQLLRSKIWWAGSAGDFFGYASQAAALALGSVILVQPILVTSLVFALPLSLRWTGRRIGRAEIVWAAVVVAALAVFTVLADASTPAVDLSPRPWLWPGVAVVAALAVLGAAAGRTRGTRKALALGAATGVAYGLIAALTEMVVRCLARDGLVGMLTAWPTWVLVAALVGGTACQQSAFHAGRLSASLPATQVLEPTVGVGLGVWALHGTMSPGGWGWAAIGLAAVAMAAGTVQLARAAAADSPER
jgi:hypothetical protein